MSWNRFEHQKLKPMLRLLKPWRTTSYCGIRVHYKRHLDGGGTGFGQTFIPFLAHRGMPKQSRIFEWCAGPGFIGFSMLAHGMCDTLCLADINPLAVRACRRTIRHNGLSDRVCAYLSGNLKAIPPTEQWDLIVSNPPHFSDAAEGDIRSRDADWHIHREFFRTVAPFLKSGGVIVLQENNRGSTPDTFREMLKHSGLSIIFTSGCTTARTPYDCLYFLGVMKQGETPPSWAL
jgi:predicted RNA methylase